jgi:glycosyltransferase involved in cell wall biosynthesis
LDTLPPRLKPSVALIIPAWNEAAAIGHVVRRVPRHIVDEIIVVDAGSTDSTVAEAEGAGARTVVERRRGYGRACATGVNSTGAEIIAFIDGDGSDDAGELERVIRPLLDNQAGLVLGTRSNVEGGAMPIYARFGNVFAAGLISIIWRQKVTDLPSCKAIRREDLIALGMSEASYGWTIEMIVKVARRGLMLMEVPLTYRARMGGESKVSGNPRASMKAAYAILRVLLRHSLFSGEAGQNGPIELLSPRHQGGIVAPDSIVS